MIWSRGPPLGPRRASQTQLFIPTVTLTSRGPQLGAATCRQNVLTTRNANTARSVLVRFMSMFSAKQTALQQRSHQITNRDLNAILLLADRDLTVIWARPHWAECDLTDLRPYRELKLTWLTWPLPDREHTVPWLWSDRGLWSDRNLPWADWSDYDLTVNLSWAELDLTTIWPRT